MIVLNTVLHDIALTAVFHNIVMITVLCDVALISALWCCIGQCFVMLHWSQFFMMLQIRGSHWRIHQVVCWILCGYLCAGNRWQTPREHHGHWGRTGGLSVMTDTQRTWVLRKDRWVECHEWHTENMGIEGGQVGWVSLLTHTEHGYLDRWVECHDWHTENMGTEGRQVGWVSWLAHREHGYWGWTGGHVGWVSWLTHREHRYWGQTGGLSVMTGTQRTWVLRMDRWGECHDWHT